jgi:LmbE family N-acetylglucosaminyl deacetylase
MAITAAAKKTLSPHTVLCVGAHPDDIDVTVGGTVAKWAADGVEIYYLVLTNGNKGSDDLDVNASELTRIRREEQRAAAKILKVREVFFSDHEDGQLDVSYEVRRDIARAIRRVRPDVVITMDPSVLYIADLGIINHPDHRAAGQSTLDAVYPLARDHLSFPELMHDEGLLPHKVRTVLLQNPIECNYTVDITEFMKQKLDAVAAHASQFQNMESIHDFVRERAREVGNVVSADYGESFIRIDVS